MAEDLTVRRPMTFEQAPPQQPKRRRFVHARRFAIAYLLLALVIALAFGLLAAGLTASSSTDKQWSSWQPSDTGEARLWEIAGRVASRYNDGTARLPFQALPGPPAARVRSGTGGETEQIPLDAAVITGRNADAVRLNTAIAYSICGRAQNCALNPESAQREFGTVLNGVLELGLYTFKYEEDVQSIVFFLPSVPAPADEAGDDGLLDTAVFLQRDDVERELDKPLAETPLHTNGRIGESVLRIIRPHLYTFTFDASSQGASLLRLTPYGSDRNG